MGLEWNVLREISIFYRYSAGSWTRYYYYQTDDGLDIFADNFAADDAIYFINNGYPSQTSVKESHSHKFAGLKLLVDIPVQADVYEYVWEYYGADGNWHPLPNVNDPSQGLSVAGDHEITWDVPSDWRNSVRACNNDWWSSGFVVRLRVTNVSNPTEGGKFGTDHRILQFNWAYTIDDGNEYTPEDIYNYDQSLGNNLVEKTEDGKYYLIKCNLAVLNGTFKVPYHTTVVVGRVGGSGNDGAEIILKDGTIEISGGMLIWNNNYYQGPYNNWRGTLRTYGGAKLVKYFGGYVALDFGAYADVVDTEISSGIYSDTIFFTRYSAGTVQWSNVNFRFIYIYTPSVSWDDMQSPGNPIVTSIYEVLGGTSKFYARIKGYDFKNSIRAYAVQGQELWLINPKNLNTSLIGFGTTYNKYSNYVIVAYELTVKVVDDKGNPVEGAKVFLRDKNGHTALIHNWFQTDGYDVEALYYPDTTSGVFYRYTDPPFYTHYVAGKPPFVEVGSTVRVRGEYLKITSLSGVNDYKFTCERNQSYNGYSSLAVGGHIGSPVYEEVEYILTGSDGIPRFTGEFGSFLPLIITDIWCEDYAGNPSERHYNPFTLIVAKEGYEPVVVPLTVEGPVSLIVKLKRSRIASDLEEME